MANGKNIRREQSSRSLFAIDDMNLDIADHNLMHNLNHVRVHDVDLDSCSGMGNTQSKTTLIINPVALLPVLHISSLFSTENVKDVVMDQLVSTVSEDWQKKELYSYAVQLQQLKQDQLDQNSAQKHDKKHKKITNIYHSLELKSIFTPEIDGTSNSTVDPLLYEPEFTNFTASFKGCLDYIFYSSDSKYFKKIASWTPGCVGMTKQQKNQHAINEKNGTNSTNTHFFNLPTDLLEGPFPSNVFPSDHIPLGVVFELTF